ncbi:MAG: type II toxin-antitoxin system HipA family toxin [Kiritimatiellia bacterium]
MTIDRLHVRLRFAPDLEMSVGTLALAGREVVFQYADDFISRKLALSPFRLPLRPGVQVHDRGGGLELFGVFEDALPDGWGRRLLDRHFYKQHGRAPTALERLACVGERGMGALTFHPPLDDHVIETDKLDLARLGSEAWQFDEGSVEDALPEIRRTGGTSGGARPKALIGLPCAQNASGPVLPGDGEVPASHAHWIVKFNARADVKEAGPLEFVYAEMAALAGADMPACRLLKTKAGRFFAVRRFDRPATGHRLHMHSAAGLLHANFRVAGEEYDTLFRLVESMTRDYAQKLELFRRVCLNVLACNRDDHLKNFAFLMDSHGTWKLAPLFDFTYNNGPNGWHTLSIAGEGWNPGRSHLMELAQQVDIRSGDAKQMLDETRAAVAQFGKLARKHGVSAPTIQRLTARFKELDA